MIKNIKVAVVGVGHLGKEHARIYHSLSDVELVAVVDKDLARAGEIAKQYGVKAYADASQVVNKITAASIAVPTDGHYEVAKPLLQQGIHLLVEKPITATLSQANRLAALAKKKKVILQVGHIERFNPIVQKLMKLVTAPKFIEIHRLSPFTPRGTEVGVVFDLMIHDIDIVLGIVNDDIKRIEAIGVPVLTPHEDIANVRITFRNGCVANITASRISMERMRKIRVFQKDTYLSLDYYRQEGSCYQKKNQEITKQDLVPGRDEPLKLELESFINTVKKGKQPLVTSTDAVKAMSVADRIVRKIWK